MKHKDYSTTRQRSIDQIMGFFAFPLLNVPLGIILWNISKQQIDSHLPTLASALPWVVNLIVLSVAFLLRPQFAIGYIAFIGFAVSVVTALGVLFVAACFVSTLSVPLIGNLAIGLFVILMAAGLCGLAILAIYVFWNWWS